MAWLRNRFGSVSRSIVALRAALATVFAGAVAVIVSQLHVLPPMLCFALLVAGLALLGGGVMLGVRRATAASAGGGEGCATAVPGWLPVRAVKPVVAPMGHHA